jgi:hypothetical protein
MSATIVPWTTPGEDPCCCEGSCYTDLQNEPVFPYSSNVWVEIPSPVYTALLAGGSLVADVFVNVTGSNPTFSETHQCNIAGVNLTFAESQNEGCYAKHTGSVEIVRFNSTGGRRDYTTNIGFAISLGTSEGRFVSLASVVPPTSTLPLITLEGLNGLTFGISLSAYTGEFSSLIAGLCRSTGVSVSNALVIDGEEYSFNSFSTSIACFVSSGSMGFISHSGSIQMTAFFIPFAP